MPHPSSTSRALPLALSFALAAALLLGNQRATDPVTVTDPIRGLLVRPTGADHSQFMEWKSIDTANQATIELLKAGGGHIQWLPGQYEIPQPIEIWDGKNIRIEGALGTTLVFPAASRPHTVLTEKPIVGQTTIHVENPEAINLYWSYQLYPPDGKGDRLLEFRVTKIEGNQLTIHPAIRFMKHVKSIPKGCMLIERVNFFEFNRCQNVSIQGFTMDGRSRGKVAGHTTHSGIIAAGCIAPDKRPLSNGLRIRNCAFLNLTGRGVAVYQTTGIQIEGCRFQNIHAQAIEIDHFSSGLVSGNSIRSAGSGITLNDAFDTHVLYNSIQDCRSSITLFRHFEKDWTNTGHHISHNVISPRPEHAAITFRQPMLGNTVEYNFFLGTAPEQMVVGGEGNRLHGNKALKIK